MPSGNRRLFLCAEGGKVITGTELLNEPMISEGSVREVLMDLADTDFVLTISIGILPEEGGVDGWD